MVDMKVLKKQHLKAFEASLKNQSQAYKVSSGEYYYRGIEISRDGTGEFFWNVNVNLSNHEAARSFKEAKQIINTLKEYNPNVISDMEWVRR